MFGIGQNKMQKLIKKDGMEHATLRFAEVICEMLKTKEYAYQFIIEEIEAANGGSDAAIKFAAESGIMQEEYKDAMQNSIAEIDGADGPQQFLLDISSQLISDIDLMVNFRIGVDEHVMRIFKLGKYSGTKDKLANILRSLKKLLEKDLHVMPSLTTNIAAPAKAEAHHISHRKENIDSAKNLINTLTESTGKDTDTIILMALDAD